MFDIVANGFLDTAYVTANSGAGGNTNVDIRPPAGEQWLIAFGGFYHGDPAARNVVYQLIGGTSTPMEIGRFTGLAQNTFKPFYTDNDALNLNPWKLPLRVNYDVYLRAVVESVAADKNCYGRFIVYKVRGIGRPAAS